MQSNFCCLCIGKIEPNPVIDVTTVNNEIYTKIQMHLNLDIKKTDISSSVCASCIEKVNEFHEYYEDVHKNQKEFNKLFNKNFETITLEINKNLQCNVDENSLTTIEKRKRIRQSNREKSVSTTATTTSTEDENIFLQTSKDNTNTKQSKSKKNTKVSSKRKINTTKNISKQFKNGSVIKEEIFNCESTVFVQNDSDDDDNVDDFVNTQKIENVTFPESVFKNGKLQIRGSELKRYMERFFLLTCDLCPEKSVNDICIPSSSKFSTINSLFTHYKTLHNIPGYVVCCGKKFHRKIMPQHFAYHVNPEEFTCKLCNFKATQQYSLKLHVERMHSIDSNRKKFNCRFCGRNYTTTTSLEQHQLEKHPSDNEEKNKFKCQECDKSFNSEYRLKKHMKNVHAEKTHICDICGTKFRLKGNLKYHQLTHSTVKNFQCEICGKGFINQNMVRRHLKRAHPSNDELKCDQCDYTTLKIENLKNHLRIKHSDEKPYSCIYCDRKFKTSTNQKEHLAQHTGIKIQCEFCSKEFLTKSNYYAHRKKAHYQELMAR